MTPLSYARTAPTACLDVHCAGLEHKDACAKHCASIHNDQHINTAHKHTNRRQSGTAGGCENWCLTAVMTTTIAAMRSSDREGWHVHKGLIWQVRSVELPSVGRRPSSAAMRGRPAHLRLKPHRAPRPGVRARASRASRARARCLSRMPLLPIVDHPPGLRPGA